VYIELAVELLMCTPTKKRQLPEFCLRLSQTNFNNYYSSIELYKAIGHCRAKRRELQSNYCIYICNNNHSQPWNNSALFRATLMFR